MYLQCIWKKPRKAIILFYAVSLLYVLSTASFVTDLVALILEVSNNSICKNYHFLSLTIAQARLITASLQIQTDSQPMLYRFSIVRGVVSGCCDFLAQCILVRINH